MNMKNLQMRKRLLKKSEKVMFSFCALDPLEAVHGYTFALYPASLYMFKKTIETQGAEYVYS